MTGSRTRHPHKAGALLQAQTQMSLPNQRQVVGQVSPLITPYQKQQKHKRVRLTRMVTSNQPQSKR